MIYSYILASFIILTDGLKNQGKLHTSFTNATLWQATTAAVSVRNRLSPKATGVKPLFIARSISSEEKSPSGPMRIVMFFLGSIRDFKDFLSVSSQCAINLNVSVLLLA